MTPEQHIKSFDKTIQDLKGQYNAEIMIGVGSTALTLLRKRVQETGTDAKGSKYKAYSTKAMLIGAKSFRNDKYAKQYLGSKEKRAEFQWRTIGGSSGLSAMFAISAGTSSGMARGGKGVRLAILPGGYAQLRRMQGMQVDHVDFTVSGAMWKSINIISKASDHQKGTVIIGARDDDSKKKLAGNTKRKGDILDLSKEEQNTLIKQYNLDALQVFKNNGL